MSDAGATETARFRAYGESLEGSAGNWGFAGRPEELGGLVPLRARTYAPALGAFLSSDPLDGYEGMPQTQVDYGYAAGSPGRFADASGQIPIDILIGLGALAFAGAIAILAMQLRNIGFEHATSGYSAGSDAEKLSDCQLARGFFVASNLLFVLAIALVAVAVLALFKSAFSLGSRLLTLVARVVTSKLSIATVLLEVIGFIPTGSEFFFRNSTQENALAECKRVAPDNGALFGWDFI